MIGEELKRNEVIYCNFGNNQKTSVQSGYRYAIVVSNNKGNRFSTVVTVIPFTTKLKKNLPTHLNIEGSRPHCRGEIPRYQSRTPRE